MWKGGSDGLMIWEVWCGRPIRRNSVLEGLWMRQLDDIQEDMINIIDSKSEIAVVKLLGEVGMKEMKTWVSSA